jgi:hypothetical protein
MGITNNSPHNLFNGGKKMLITKEEMTQIITDAKRVGIPPLSDEYWDCNCMTDYIHSYSEESCPICHAHNSECPDSHYEEVILANLPVTRKPY